MQKIGYRFTLGRLAQSIAGIIWARVAIITYYHRFTEKLLNENIIIPKGHNVDLELRRNMITSVGKAIEAGMQMLY